VRLAPGRRLAAVVLLAATAVVAGPGTGTASAPDSQTIKVDSANPAGATTTPLTAGVAYTVSARGVYHYGLPGDADAECATLIADPSWQPHRWVTLNSADDDLDLYVDGKAVEWTAPGGAACSPDHSYTYSFTPTATKPATFAIHDQNGSSDNVGILTVVVTGPPLAEPVPLASPSTSTPSGAARPARTPRGTRVLGQVATAAAPGVPSRSRIATTAVPPANVAQPPGTLPLYARFGPSFARFGEMRHPPVARRPFHLTVLGALVLVLAVIGVVGGGVFLLATRTNAIDTGLRGLIASAWRLALRRAPAE
jgi:hypothetical protein